jgi:hypothetical protein
VILLLLLSYTIPVDSPIMDNIEYLQIRGLIDIPSIRPYELEWIIPQIDELLINDVKLNLLDRKTISFFNPLLTKNQDFSYLIHGNALYQYEPEYWQGFFDLRFGGQLAKNFRFSQALRFQRASDIDTTGPKSWHDFQVYLTEGMIKAETGLLHFDFGRRNYLLGFGDESDLLLSLDPQGYDGFLIYVPTRYFEFYNIFSVLDASQNQYISIHRIGIDLKRFLRIGFSEALLFGQSLEPVYLNPFLPYYLSQWGLDRNDNIMWCFDLQLRLFKSIIYGELLIDDYMYEDDPYPDKLAYKTGFKSVLFNNFLVKMDYTFVDKWVYTHRIEDNIYVHGIHPLGFPLGNDVDRLSCNVKYMNQYGFCPVVAFEYVRKGQGSIFLPYEQEGGTWTPPFPSGVVERKLEVDFGFDLILRYNFYCSAKLGKRYWRNYSHMPGNDVDDTVLDMSLWAIL